MVVSRKFRKGLRQKRQKRQKSLRRQRGGNKPTIVVFDLNDTIGFFSQFWFLCQAYIYAKINEYPFFVNSSNWNYKSEHGWHDYFKSLKEYKEDDIPKDIKRFAHQNNHGIPTYKIIDYINAVKEIYILNDDISAKIRERVKEYGPYNSIYVRRGDKRVENPMNPIKEIVGLTDLKDDGTQLFVQTDDYGIIGELKAILPSVKMLSITSEEKKGAEAHHILMMDSKKRREETENFLISIGIFLAGEKCWTDIRSNVGRFHKIADFKKVKYYPDNKDVDINKEVIPQYSI